MQKMSRYKYFVNSGVKDSGGIVCFIYNTPWYGMHIIFSSSVALVWTFDTRGVHDFISRKANIPVNLVPFFNAVSFLFCRFLDSGVTNKLKKSFSQGNLFKTGHNSAARITLVYPKYVWRTATALFFF